MGKNPVGKPNQRLTSKRSRLVYDTEKGYLVEYGVTYGESDRIDNLSKGELSSLLIRHLNIKWEDVAEISTESRITMLRDYITGQASGIDGNLRDWKCPPWVPKNNENTDIPTSVLVPEPEPETVPDFSGVWDDPEPETEPTIAPTLDMSEVENLIKDIVAERVKIELEHLRPIVTNVVLPTGEIVGSIEGQQHSSFKKILRLVQRGIHVYMPGEPGTGKTQLAENIAKVMGLQYGFISCAGVPQDHKLEGFIDANGNIVNTRFIECYRDGGVFLIDEIDAAYPATMVALNAALAGKRMATAGGIIERHKDFHCLAAANTIGNGASGLMNTRQEVDKATRTRFFMVPVDTDESLESALVNGNYGLDPYKATQLLNKVHQMRVNRNLHNIGEYITMRQTLGVATAISGADPFPMDEAIEDAFRMGLSDGEWAKVIA